MKYTRSISALFFFVAFACGVWAARTSWDGTIFLSKTSFLLKTRDPAAIRKDVDYDKLDGAELITSSQKRLVSAARVLLEGDAVGLEFGHFVTRDANGDRQLACEYYDRMHLRFEADGIATGGEKPVLEVEAPCRTGSDISRIEPIWIPVKRIMGEKPGDMDLTFPDQEGVNFKFREMGSEWPTTWALQSVRLYNDGETGREVNLSGHELRVLRDRPIVLNWPDNERKPTNTNEPNSNH